MIDTIYQQIKNRIRAEDLTAEAVLEAGWGFASLQGYLKDVLGMTREQAQPFLDLWPSHLDAAGYFRDIDIQFSRMVAHVYEMGVRRVKWESLSPEHLRHDARELRDISDLWNNELEKSEARYADEAEQAMRKIAAEFARLVNESESDK